MPMTERAGADARGLAIQLLSSTAVQLLWGCSY
jgi:hypothetical protein